MSASPYVPFYTSDFLGGTSGMTAASKGVYITLICLIYEAEAPLPQSWDTLARRCGCTLPAFKKAVEALQDDGKIEVTGAGIWSDKCAKHIAQRRERQSSATAAAKTRWEKIKENQRTDDKAALNPQCQPEPEPEPEVKKDTTVSLQTKPVRKKCRIPENAVISDAQIRAAEKRGHSMQEAEAQFSKFKNDALAKGKMFLDWDRAFITWLDSEYFRPITDGARNGNGNHNTNGSRSGGSGNAMVDAFAAVAAERTARNGGN